MVCDCMVRQCDAAHASRYAAAWLTSKHLLQSARMGLLQVGWLVDAEMMSWSDGIERQFHRHKKAQPKLALAYQQVHHSCSKS